MHTMLSTPIPTLCQVFDEYLCARTLSSETIRNYKLRFKNLSDWMDLPIDEISGDMVAAKHASIAGKATANATVRTLRAVLKFAGLKYEDVRGLPIICAPVVTPIELHKLRLSTAPLSADDLQKWYRAVWSLDNTSARDLLLLVLFTGLPVKEAMSLQWSQVSLPDGSMTIFQGDIVHVIPLPDFIWMILNVRHFGALSEYVFPGIRGCDHMLNSAASFQTVKRRSGVQFSAHDLKSTFRSVCKELKIDDPYKFMAGRSEARLRRSMTQIAKVLLERCGVIEVPR